MGDPRQPLTQAGCGHQGQAPAIFPSLECPSAALGRREGGQNVEHTPACQWAACPLITSPSPDAGPSAALAGDKVTASPLRCGAIQPLPVRPVAIPLQPHVEDRHVSCAHQESLEQERTRMSSLGEHPAPATQLVMGAVQYRHSIAGSLPGGLASLWARGPEPGSCDNAGDGWVTAEAP